MKTDKKEVNKNSNPDNKKMKTKSLDFPTESDVNDKYIRKPQLRDVNIDDVPEDPKTDDFGDRISLINHIRQLTIKKSKLTIKIFLKNSTYLVSTYYFIQHLRSLES